MLKKILALAGALTLNSLIGCAVIDRNQEFVYPQVVKNLENKNSHFSLENIVRKKDVFYAGASAIEISPHNSQYIAGFNANRASNGVQDDIFSRCIVVSYNDKTIAFVSLDLIGFMHENVQDVRYLVSKIKGNFVDEVVISSTHTHSGPDTIGMWGFGLPFLPLNSGIDKEYMSFVYDKITKSVYVAAKDLKEAKIKCASVELSANKKISRNYHEEMPNLIDRQLSVLQFCDANGKNIALLTNYGCHPEALNRKNKKISPDFVGVLNNSLEKSLGGVSVFFNQSIGGLITTDIDDSRSDDLNYLISESQRIGKTLANESLDCLKSAKKYSKPEIKFYRSEFFVPVENNFFLIGNKLGIIAKKDYAGFVKTEVNRIDIGDAQIVTVPGEIFPNVGTAIKREMTGEVNIIIGLGNDELGYIMFPKEFDNSIFSYEKTMSVGKKAGLLVEENAQKLLKN